MRDLILLVFASWRLSNLLVNEAGPGNVLVKLRKLTGIYYDERSKRQSRTFIGDLFNCIWCMSVWVGLLMVILNQVEGVRKWFVTPLGLAGLVVFLDSKVKE